MISPGEQLRRLLSDFHGLVSDALGVFLCHARASLVFWVAMLLGATVLHTADAPLAAALSPPHRDSLQRLAVVLSRWGDYGTGILAVSLGTWLVGVLLKRDRLRRAGVACFLAATLALLSVNAIKTVSGRPRPYTGMPDEFTGLNLEEELRSFPSGHSASAMAAAASLSSVFPAVAAPAALGAVGVAWSRMYLEQHYLTDVLVGGAIGIWLGLVFGLAVRRSEAISGKKPAP